MKKTRNILLIIFAVVLFDQLTKCGLIYLLTGGVPLFGRAFDIVPFPYMISQITNFFNIVFTWNPGTSFSLFRSIGESAPIVIIVLTGAVIGFLAHYLFKRSGANEKLPLALILGGAMGNLIDRVRYGAVIDFLDFHIGGLHWPAFNIADICIAAGVGLYILNLIITRAKK